MRLFFLRVIQFNHFMEGRHQFLATWKVALNRENRFKRASDVEARSPKFSSPDFFFNAEQTDTMLFGMTEIFRNHMLLDVIMLILRAAYAVICAISRNLNLISFSKLLSAEGKIFPSTCAARSVP